MSQAFFCWLWYNGNMEKETIQKLKGYFEKREDVVMAFLFGSHAKGRVRRDSDWDIGVYVIPQQRQGVELEAGRDIPERGAMHADVEKITGGDVDLVVLNNAAPSVVYTALNRGTVLAQKDRVLYLELLRRSFYEALDFWRFTEEFARAHERSRSLSPEDRAVVTRHFVFLKNELAELPRFAALTQKQYTEEKDMRRNVERWVENMVMVALDIAKILLASKKRDVPDSYQETLRAVGFSFLDESGAAVFADFAGLRNFIAHEYLDLRWKEIFGFIGQAATLYPQFVSYVKKELASDKGE